MAIFRYRQSFNTETYLNILNRQLPPADQIAKITPSRSVRIAVDAPNGAEDDLDEVMGVLGFESLGSGDDLNSLDDHGIFSVATAPTIDIEEGDRGHCSDGDDGSSAPVWYNGTNWIVLRTNNVISAGVGGGVATASVSNGGAYVGTAGNYGAFQASTSGSGFGAAFTITLDGAGQITAVVSVDGVGSGYAVSDTITLIVVGITEVSAAVLNVDSIT